MQIRRSPLHEGENLQSHGWFQRGHAWVRRRAFIDHAVDVLYIFWLCMTAALWLAR